MTPKEAWNKFKGSNKVISIKLQSLWRNFASSTMKEEKSIQTFFSHIFSFIHPIKSYCDMIKKKGKKIIQNILRALPPKFNYVVATIKVSKDPSKLTLVKLMEILVAYKERMQKLDDPLKQAFQSKLNISNNEGDNKNNNN